jgi:cytochrome bd-type quinol oxidase subunit 2
MFVRPHLPGYRWFHVFRNAAIRTGVYVGVCLTLVFSAWLVIANRAPILERFALERNIAAAAILGFLAVVPIFRFLRLPGHLLASSLIGWLIFSLSYRALCLLFRGLSNWHSTLQVFMLGAVVYMILTTLSWIATTIWRAREAHASHPNHHAS